MSDTSKPFTIHTARTLMIAELSQLFDYAGQEQNYGGAINNNVAGKRTQANRKQSYQLLKKLYRLDPAYPPFAALHFFWLITKPSNRPLLAFLYALGHDYLLAETLPIVAKTAIGNSVSVSQFNEAIATEHPDRFPPVSQYAIAQRLASSFKQAGYLAGKVNVTTASTAPTCKSSATSIWAINCDSANRGRKSAKVAPTGPCWTPVSYRRS